MTDADRYRLEALARAVKHGVTRSEETVWLLGLVEAGDAALAVAVARNADLLYQVDTLRRDSDAYARGLLDAADVADEWWDGAGRCGVVVAKLAARLRAMADGQATTPPPVPKSAACPVCRGRREPRCLTCDGTGEGAP